MINSVFGEMNFNTGWKTEIVMSIWGQSYSIVIKAKAYYEKDGITDEQEKAFLYYNEHKETIIASVEKMLAEYSGSEAAKRFVPRILLFERNGEFALLCDDNDDIDGGVAVCLEPIEKVILQDEYL